MARRREDGTAIRADDLSIGTSSGLRVVDGVSFSLLPGQTMVISGRTGSGKSSLAAVLAGAASGTLNVIGGDAAVCGISVRRPGRLRREWDYATGYLPQLAGAVIPPRLTVGETIAEPITSRTRKANPQALAVRVASLLDEMQLPLGLADHYPYELSAGMLQRVAFARAMVLDPKVFIADDPMANLDVEVRRVVCDAIRRRQRNWGLAALLVTNDPELARELDADALTLHGGSVVAVGDYRAIPRPDAIPGL